MPREEVLHLLKEYNKDDDAEKTSALNLICKKYFDSAQPMAAEGIRGTLVLAVEMAELTAKQSGNWE